MRQLPFLLGLGLVTSAWLALSVACKTNKQTMDVGKPNSTATGPETLSGTGTPSGSATGTYDPDAEALATTPDTIAPESTGTAEPTINDPSEAIDPDGTLDTVGSGSDSSPSTVLRSGAGVGTDTGTNSDPLSTDTSSFNSTFTSTGTNTNFSTALPPPAGGQPSSNNQLVMGMIQKLLSFAGIGGGGNAQGFFGGGQGNTGNQGNQTNQGNRTSTNGSNNPDANYDPDNDIPTTTRTGTETTSATDTGGGRPPGTQPPSDGGGAP